MEKCQENVLEKKRFLKIFRFFLYIYFFAAVRTSLWFNSSFRELILRPATCETICDARQRPPVVLPTVSELGVGVPPSLLRTGGGASTPKRTEQRKPFNTLTRCQLNSLNIVFDLFPSYFCGKCTFQKLASSSSSLPPSTNRQT